MQNVFTTTSRYHHVEFVHKLWEKFVVKLIFIIVTAVLFRKFLFMSVSIYFRSVSFKHFKETSSAVRLQKAIRLETMLLIYQLAFMLFMLS